jgi:eukaryotic translation initiation factor 2C
VRATLAVSYAAPAYYADRLCERGRAYLREWFSPNKYWRDDEAKYKDQYGQEVEQKREQLNANQPARGKGKKMTREEIKAKKEDAQLVEEKLKEHQRLDFEKRFFVKPDKEAAERLAGFQETMYWM